jgi:formylmethanofuran dehydrogenase subunit E
MTHCYHCNYDFIGAWCPKCGDTEADLECDECGEKVKEVFPTLYYDGDKKLVCRSCLDRAEIRADAEYERQREESDNEERF